MLNRLILTLSLCILTIGTVFPLDVPDNLRSLATGDLTFSSSPYSIFGNPALAGDTVIPKIGFALMSTGLNVQGSGTFGFNIDKDIGGTIGATLASDTFFGLALGKRMDSLSLGLTLRLAQRQSANLTSTISDFNADLGAMLQWKDESGLLPDRIFLLLENVAGTHIVLSEELHGMSPAVGLYSSKTGYGVEFKLSSPMEIKAGIETPFLLGKIRAGVRMYNGGVYPAFGYGLLINEDEIAYAYYSGPNNIAIHTIGMSVDVSPSKKAPEFAKEKEEMISFNDSIKSYNNLAMEYYQAGKLKEAIDVWGKVLKLDRYNELAEKYIKNASISLTATIEGHFADAENFTETNKWDKAVESLEKILGLKPDEGTASSKIGVLKTKLIEAYNAGKIYSEEKEYVRAIDRWQWALDHFPNYSDCSELIDKASNDLKKTKGQKELLDKYYSNAELYLKGNDLSSAVEELNKLLNLDPSHEKALALMANLVKENFDSGMTYFSKNQYDKAVEEWKKVLNIDPANEKARFYVAEAQKQLDDKIIKFFNAGIDDYNAGNYIKAIEQWQTALKSDPSHKEMNEYMIKAYISQGIAYYRQEKLKEAVDFWEKALKLKPGEEKAALYLKRAKNKIKMLSEIENK